MENALNTIKICRIQGKAITPVKPSDIKPYQLEGDYDNAIRIILWLVFCVLIFMIVDKSDMARELTGWIWFVPFILPFGFVHNLMEKIRDRRRRREMDKETSQRLNASISEAKNTSKTACRHYEESFSVVCTLTDHQDKARQTLARAETEFSAKAYAPFWDQVEATVFHMANFEKTLHRLSDLSDSYKRCLTGRKHDFPAFAITPANLPDIRQTVAELHRVVRRGQTDFEFAMIWEQRRTRDAITAGFETLEAAVSGLEHKIDQSLKDLIASLQQAAANRAVKP